MVSTGIDLALVPTFVEVVRHGSFTKAARALGLPKSTVSRHVSKLEAQLDTPLLVRTTRHVRLTEGGERFFRRVSHIVESVDEAVREVSEHSDIARGVLRITVPPDYDQIAPMVASFSGQHPELTIDINVSGETVDLVREGYDLAIRAGRLRDSTLVARRLQTVEFQVFGSRTYLERRGTPAAIAQLADHSCVLFRPTHGVRRWRLVGPTGEATVDVRGQIWVDDLMLARAAVVADVGLALLPSSLFDRDDPAIQRVLPDYAMPAGAVHLVYPGTRHLPAKVRLFRDHALAFVTHPSNPVTSASERASERSRPSK